MSKLQQAVDHLINDDNWKLVGEKQLFIDALQEIEHRLEKLEKE